MQWGHLVQLRSGLQGQRRHGKPQGTRPGTLIVFVAVEAGLLSRGKESQGNGMWVVHDAQASPGQAARGMVTMAPCSVQGPRCVPPRPEQRLPVTAERTARAWPRAWFVNKQTRHSHAPQPLSPAPSLTRHSPACHVLVTHGQEACVEVLAPAAAPSGVASRGMPCSKVQTHGPGTRPACRPLCAP